MAFMVTNMKINLAPSFAPEDQGVMRSNYRFHDRKVVLHNNVGTFGLKRKEMLWAFHRPCNNTTRGVTSMMTSSNGNISALLAFCAGNSPVTGEFLSQRLVTRSFHVLFDLCLNKRLSKQSWGGWFETPLCPLWRHCNEFTAFCGQL